MFGAGEQGLEKAYEARKNHTNELMSIKGVVGVALGLNPAGEGAVLVFAKEPGVTGIPQDLDDGVPVHVRVTGEIFALCHQGGKDSKGCENPPPPPEPGSDCPYTTENYRPACTGISTGHPNITAGTICCRVTKGGSRSLA